MSNDILNAVQEYMINGHVSDAPFIINDYVITLERLDNGVRISATRGGQTESVVVYDGDLTNLNHEVLANRNANDQHPINAISGLRSELDSKQPVISDLEQIRTNAGKGATAVQHNELSDVAMTGSYNDLNGKPNLSRVATSGSYNDLVDKPSMVLDHNNLTGRSGYNQHPMSSITGLIDNLNGKQGVITDLSEIRANARKADTAVQPADLARVATTGSYNDLTDKPASVRWDVDQHLDHTSRARARGNIGATLRELLNEDYTVERIMLPSSSLTIQTQFGMKFAQFGITGAAGNRIVMTLNGVKYECDRGVYSDSNDTPFRYYYGNASIYNFMFDNTEEPFVLFTTGIENAAAMLIFRSDYAESTATVSITTYDAYANSIPYANMPSGYPTISIGETYAMIDGDYYVSEDYGYNNTPFNKDYSYTVNFENNIHRYEPTDIHSFTEGDYSGYYIGNGSLNTWADVPGPDTGEDYCLAFYEGEEDYVYFFFTDDEPHRIGCFVHHPDVIDKIDDRFVKVTDVQVNGTSVVTDGVANVPIAGVDTHGVLRAGNYNYGTIVNDAGDLFIMPSMNADIDRRQAGNGYAANVNNRCPIVPSHLDYAVKAAMTDGKGAAWTATEQAAARERIGVTDVTSQSITNALGYTPVRSTEIPHSLSELTQDATHRTVTDDEKTEWNASNREIVKIIDQMELAQKSKLNITGLSLDDVFVDVSIPFFEDAPYNIITIESGSKDVAYNVLSELKWPNDGTYYRRVASTCAIKIGDCRFIFCTAYKRTGVTTDIVVSSSGVGDMLTKITGKITGITSIYDFPQGTRVTVYGR